MLSLHTIQVVEVVIGQVQSCANPDLLQMGAIVALVGAVLVGFGASFLAIAAVAATMVQQIIAGASIFAIAAAIEADIQTTGISLGIVTALVAAIMEILGC